MTERKKMSETAQVKPPALLLVNLGTPDEPTPNAVRRFLRQFLSDKRVIEYPAALWKPILEGIILRVRPKKVAHAYQTIWSPEGSPLIVGTKAQAHGLQQYFGSKVQVEIGMCYGSHQLQATLDRLMEQGHRQIAVLHVYPQYSASTVAAIYDQVSQWILSQRDLPEIRFCRSYPTAPAYIEALAQAVEYHWATYGRPDFAAGERLITSYHSIPMAMHRAGDPYKSECEAGALALAQRLQIPEGGLQVTYQSVFGPAEWIGPATIDTLTELGEAGCTRLDVICPGFYADCLETLEEINIQNRAAYESNGGTNFHYISWANGTKACIDSLVAEAETLLAGWI